MGVRVCWSARAVVFFFFSSRRRHTRCREVSWARRCVQETGRVHGTGMILKRGAEIKDNVLKEDLFILTVEIPLANMFGYSAELRGLTQGTGEFMMDYLRHDEMYEADARKVRASFKKRKKKEVRGRQFPLKSFLSLIHI
eukprot:TRINITY_DN15985_c0_g1_i1.p1 TRINITY_DN15985_c0_g1~~TRINITY_DN15985_c0_g1_i1.p1  ORF type:complete len:140 (-),score=49.82 TRINITY_DN15985_c0_g1_i1:182-601(-)